MKTRIGIVMARVAGVAFLLGAGADAPKPVQVSARDLTRGAVVVTGELGRQLGEYVTVEGDYFGPRDMTKCGLYVDRIDGINRGATVVILVDDQGLTKPLEAGKRYRLRGFDTGIFSGVPDDPQNPPTKEQLQQRQMAGPYVLRFETVFYVTKAEDLGPIQGAKP